MSEVQTIKETKEVVVGLIAVAALLGEVFKDGVQVADIKDILVKIESNPELKAKIEAAYVDADKVKSEVTDVSVMEMFEVVQAAIPELLKLIQAVKK